MFMMIMMTIGYHNNHDVNGHIHNYHDFDDHDKVHDDDADDDDDVHDDDADDDDDVHDDDDDDVQDTIAVVTAAIVVAVSACVAASILLCRLI